MTSGFAGICSSIGLGSDVSREGGGCHETMFDIWVCLMFRGKFLQLIKQRSCSQECLYFICIQVTGRVQTWRMDAAFSNWG